MLHIILFFTNKNKVPSYLKLLKKNVVILNKFTLYYTIPMQLLGDVRTPPSSVT
jgi:hypothetical protein